MPNPNPPVNPRSVKAAGGWRNYLNREDIRAEHNGLGTDDLLRLRDIEGEPWSLIAKKFGVASKNTVKGWHREIKADGDNLPA